MSRLQALRERKQTLAAQIKAQADTLTAEGHVETAEESAAWDSLNADYNRVCRDVDRLETAELALTSANRINTAVPVLLPADTRASGVVDTPRVPARPRRTGALRAFKGPDAVRDAERVGMWAAATLFGSSTAARWCAENGVQVARGDFGGFGAVLQTTDNAKGGYLAPDEMDFAVHELALQFGVFRRFADVVSMGAGVRSTPRWTAGMTAYWMAEGAKPTSSDPAWDLIQLVAKNLGALTKMTRQIDEDSAVDLGDKITLAMAEAFSYAEDNAGFNGDASATYGGIQGLITKILASSAAFAQAAAGQVSPATLTLDSFNAVSAKLPNWPNFSPVWFMHKTVWSNSAQRLQMNLGGVVPADVQAGAKPMLLGYPVEFVNVMSAAPTVNEIAAILGDLRWSSKVGDRRGRTVEAGFENDDFTKGLISVLGTQRVDVVNHTVTDPRDSAKTGPVCGLKLAAA